MRLILWCCRLSSQPCVLHAGCDGLHVVKLEEQPGPWGVQVAELLVLLDGDAQARRGCILLASLPSSKA